jgi:ATP-dependent DNA helicase RecG
MKHSNRNPLDVEEKIAQGMGRHLHWFPVDVSPSRLAEVLVGMANTEGGTVLVGVAPRSDEIQGVVKSEELIDRVFQAALLIDPMLILPLPRLVKAKRAQVLEITVPAGLPNVYSIDGRYLGREGFRTVPLSPRRLRQLLLDRGVVKFESLFPPGATFADLDDSKVSAFVSALNLPEDESIEEILLRRGCLGYDERKVVAGSDLESSSLRPTYAGLLLLGSYPQRWLPNATILAARFSGSTLTDRFVKQDIRGTLPEQLRLAEEFVRENVRKVVRLVGFTHEETSEYPLAAVRELLVNAVVHRDYNVQGDNVHLNIFADRIEVHSPGGLPGPVNLENLLEVRFSRNAVIVQALSDLGYVERLGYGLNRVVEVMRQNGLQTPKFEETAGTFRVTLFSEQMSPAIDLPRGLDYYQVLELNSRQQMALNFLVRRRRITNREYQELCPEVHSETLRRDLVDLVERNIVIKVGDKRATYYILKK